MNLTVFEQLGTPFPLTGKLQSKTTRMSRHAKKKKTDTKIIQTLHQGSPKCGIVGGDKTEVEGEIGASREDSGECSPGKFLKIYNT